MQPKGFLSVLGDFRFHVIADCQCSALDCVDEFREEGQAPCPEMEKGYNLVLPAAYSQVFVGGCLGVKDEETALSVVSEEATELVKVAALAVAFGIYDAGVVIVELVCEAVYLVYKHYGALVDTLLKQEVLRLKPEGIFVTADFYWYVGVKLGEGFSVSLLLKYVPEGVFKALAAVEVYCGFYAFERLTAAKSSSKADKGVIFDKVWLKLKP